MASNNNVNNIINDIISHPEFINSVQNVVRRTENTGNGQNLPSTSTSSSTSVASSQILLGPRNQNLQEEMRRLFPSIRPNRASSHPRKRKHCEANLSFKRDVILVNSPNIEKTLTGKQKSYSYNNGFIISAINFSKQWSEQKIYDHIYSLFSDKFKFITNSNFDIMLPIGGRLVKPNLTSDATMNGETLCTLFQQKQIYIRPKDQIFSAISEPDISEHDISELNISEPAVNPQNEETINEFLLQTERNEQLENYDFFNEATNELLYQTENESYSKSNEANSLNDVLIEIKKMIVYEKSNIFNIYRNEIFKCCVRGMNRKNFSPYYSIDVKFSDIDGATEGAIDNGGPMREMFRLLINHLNESDLFEGPKYKKNITLNSNCINRNDYFEAGRIIALAIMHCGIGPRFFSKTLLACILNDINSITPTVEEINDERIKEEIKKIINSKTLNELQTELMDTSYLSIAGISCYVQDFEQKNQIVKDAIKFFVIHRAKPALDQLIEGLKTVNILGFIEKYPDYFEEIFCYKKIDLTYQLVEDLFEINLSIEGCNQRSCENRLVAYWRDYLLDCEENDSERDGVTLSNILCFFTGIDYIPPLGFNIKAKLKFLHFDSCPYPKANTCALELLLPIVHNTYEDFKFHMDYGIKNGMVFGFE